MSSYDFSREKNRIFSMIGVLPEVTEDILVGAEVYKFRCGAADGGGDYGEKGVKYFQGDAPAADGSDAEIDDIASFIAGCSSCPENVAKAVLYGREAVNDPFSSDMLGYMWDAIGEPEIRYDSLLESGIVDYDVIDSASSGISARYQGQHWNIIMGIIMGFYAYCVRGGLISCSEDLKKMDKDYFRDDETILLKNGQPDLCEAVDFICRRVGFLYGQNLYVSTVLVAFFLMQGCCVDENRAAAYINRALYEWED